MGQDILNSCSESGSGNFAVILRAVVREMPSALEQFLYVATLRNAEAFDAFLRRVGLVGCANSEADQAIWQLHRTTFTNWLGLNLEEKLADLEGYAARRGRPVAEAVGEWLAPTKLAGLIPSRTRAPEERLFRGDVAALLTIVKEKKAPH